MAEIIVLAKWREKHSGRAAARSAQTAQAVTGEILIYTGVRYERHEPVEARATDIVAVRAEI
ncbi:hypothetical protein ACQKKX_02750 [Neorhizobium sp. NPDC001467]|uniref:hypothetical protein n=1 Tax=Neorhizobium sp. NPDC001467 TaxID=3390595 RepID=UPI003CFCDAF7